MVDDRLDAYRTRDRQEGSDGGLAPGDRVEPGILYSQLYLHSSIAQSN